MDIFIHLLQAESKTCPGDFRCKDNEKHSNGQIFCQKYVAVKDPTTDEGT